MQPADEQADPDLASERAFYHAYAHDLDQERLRKTTIAGPANTFYTQSGVPHAPIIPDAELAGRVALAAALPECANQRDFYIGSYTRRVAGRQVFSWTSSVAALFYHPVTCTHAWAAQLVALRTLETGFGTIIDIEDQPIRLGYPDPFPLHDLPVPPLPTRVTLPPTQPPHHTSRTTDTEIRAPRLLEAALMAPRSPGLSSLIATLQPDQYDLCTRPASRNLVVTGHAGAGKTVVAAHRAVWLANPDRIHSEEEHNLSHQRILVIGPTRGWADHVQNVVNTFGLDEQRVEVLALSQLYARITRNPPPVQGIVTASDVDAELLEVCKAAVSAVRRTGRNPTAPDVWEILRAAARARSTASSLLNQPRMRAYCATLPTFHEARRNKRFHTLLALVAWLIAPPPDLRSVGHIIVDEAQNLGPLDWHVLFAVNPQGTWTILADPNQQVRPHGMRVESIASLIDLEPRTVEYLTMDRIYRSTQAIINFADQLIASPAPPRAAVRRDGAPPQIKRAINQGPGATALELIPHLITEHPAGLVAMIAQQPARYERQLRTRDWWPLSDGSHLWKNAERQLYVLSPEQASGLEFDAVVVVEPNEILHDTATGRAALYTALTRANHKLVVVHSKGMPEELARGVRG